MSAMDHMEWDITASTGPRYIVRFTATVGDLRAFAETVVESESPILGLEVQERLMGEVATLLEVERAAQMTRRREALARIG